MDPNLVRGAAELERTERGLLPHRLPAWARAQCDDPQLLGAQAQPSGVRLAFRTSATVVELDAYRTTMSYVGVPRRPDGVYDLLLDGKLHAQATSGGGTMLTVDMATGAVDTEHGPHDTVRFAGLPDGEKDVQLWLPHNERIELLDLRADAPLTPAPPDGRRVWLHHGSSISQGSNAASPSTTWTALAAAAGDVELVNVGLSGSALLDPFTARTLRDTPADLVSVKLGINVVNGDVMRLRAFGPAVHGFLDTVREGHPTAPLLVVGPILCPIHEETPGPGAFDPEGLRAGKVLFQATGEPGPGKLTLSVIRDELARIVQRRADPNLHYLDGRELYGEADFAERPLPDRLHPDAATHRSMAERFAALAFGPGGPFGAA